MPFVQEVTAANYRALKERRRQQTKSALIWLAWLLLLLAGLGFLISGLNLIVVGPSPAPTPTPYSLIHFMVLPGGVP